MGQCYLLLIAGKFCAIFSDKLNKEENFVLGQISGGPQLIKGKLLRAGGAIKMEIGFLSFVCISIGQGHWLYHQVICYIKEAISDFSNLTQLLKNTIYEMAWLHPIQIKVCDFIKVTLRELYFYRIDYNYYYQINPTEKHQNYFWLQMEKEGGKMNYDLLRMEASRDGDRNCEKKQGIEGEGGRGVRKRKWDRRLRWEEKLWKRELRRQEEGVEEDRLDEGLGRWRPVWRESGI